MPAHFKPAALKFLKALKRNNDRDWFNERKAVYEAELKLPWLLVLEEVNRALESFAPDCIRPPHKAMFRIYRDTRFSKNKLPYKTHIGAWWSPASLGKAEGAGYYTHVGADEVFVAAGLYMPQPEHLLAVRRHLQQHHGAMRTIMAGKKLRTLMPVLDNNPLTRMPKGFAADDPAADLLLSRQWAISTSLPADLALSADLVGEITRRFRAATPMVELLNAALRKPASPRKSIF